MNETIENRGGDGRVAEEVGPFVKSLVGSNDDGGFFGHGGDKNKEEIRFDRLQGLETDFIDDDQSGFVKYPEGAFCWRR